MKKLFFSFFVAFMSAVSSVMQGAIIHVTDGTLWYRLYTDTKELYVTYYTDTKQIDYSNVGPDLIIPEYLYDDAGTIYSVVGILEGTFSTGKNITSVVIPETMRTIGDRVFSQCTSLTSVVWNAKNSSCSSTTFCDWYYKVQSQITNFTFGEKVRSIPANVCLGMTNLTFISIPRSATSIGNNAFSGCSRLTSITIPTSVTRIGNGAFSDCSSLKSCTFVTDDIASTNGNDTVFFLNTNSWGDVYAYAWNSSESNEEWPGVPAQKLQYTYLGYDVYYFVADKGKFDNCIFNNTGYGAGNQTDDLVWTSGMCYNNDNWVSIEKHDLEASVEIGASAFEDCVGLTAISIPECVKTIGESAFQNCSNIETITIGSNVTDIGESAFSGCQSVYEITCKATKAPNVYESTFENVSTLATLYVPAESVQKYKIHAVWSRFFNIEPIEESEEAIDSANQDGASVNQKIICNGQVLIVRDGEIYSILGEKIE